MIGLPTIMVKLGVGVVAISSQMEGRFQCQSYSLI
jgi:hypothetical protein